MMTQHQRETLAACLGRVFGQVDDAFVEAAAPLLRWIELNGGKTLMREGDAEDGVYFVISGRLRAYARRDGDLVAVGEIARGETVGEMGVLTGEPRSATVVAVRNTVLAHATREAFERLLERDARLPIRMARIVVERLRKPPLHAGAGKPAVIAVAGITARVDAASLGRDVARELSRWGSTAFETSATIDERLAPGAAQSAQADLHVPDAVASHIDELEFANDFVLLVADPEESGWTRRCLRRADEVLLLADAGAPPAVHPVESSCCMGDEAITGARQTLVLLHDPETPHPEGTPAWLDRRPVDAHVHVRRGSASDLARLGRIVSGNAVGLVLAGGGARGFAHLGTYKALREAGVEIDFVGGTSIGAVMASYISFGLEPDDVIAYARKAFSRNPTGDLNLLPMVSLIRGKRLRRAISRGLDDVLGHEADMTDSWRTMFCVATSYSGAREQVIMRGPLARAIRASVSIPVALPPVTWDGELLIDGGVFNNFPTNVMARLGARRIIGVDLARRSQRRYDYDEVPGPLAVLWDRVRGRRRRVPGLGAFLMGTTILYSESRREQARQSVDLYLNPDLARVSLLNWKAFDRIVGIGYQHAREVLSAMTAEELAPYRSAGSPPPAARRAADEREPQPLTASGAQI